MNVHALGKTLGAEDHRDERHQYHAAAYAQQARQEAAHGAHQQQDQHQADIHQAPFLSSLTMAFHCAAVTGVIDNRLPFCSTTMSSSAGMVRISASDSSRVFCVPCTSTEIQRGCSGVALGS